MRISQVRWRQRVPEYRVRLTAGDVSKSATLAGNATARAVWDALPIEGRANRWGDEIYFSIPVDLAEEDAQEEVAVGDLAYWPPGNALCIFWGPTPASHAHEPRAASPVNVFGHIAEGAEDFAGVKSGERVRVERLE
jgi:hypothetical protein